MLKWLEMRDKQTNNCFCGTNNCQEGIEVSVTVGCCSIYVVPDLRKLLDKHIFNLSLSSGPDSAT